MVTQISLRQWTEGIISSKTQTFMKREPQCNRTSRKTYSSTTQTSTSSVSYSIMSLCHPGGGSGRGPDDIEMDTEELPARSCSCLIFGARNGSSHGKSNMSGPVISRTD